MKQLGTRVSETTYAQKERLRDEGGYTVREILTLGIQMLYSATFGAPDHTALLERAKEITKEGDAERGE